MAPAAAAAAALSDDLLREILLRLPTPADLARASLASKPFLRAARNAAFLRRFRRLHSSSSCPFLLGCLLLHSDHPDYPFPILIPSSSSSSSAGCARDGDFSLSFLPRGGWLGGGGDSGGAAWQLLDCRNGRFLVKNRASRELAVADPLARRCVSLPPLPAADRRLVGYGLVADYGDSSAFRVFFIAHDGGDGDGDGEMRALVLSSGELSWAVAGLPGRRPNLAGARAFMQANGSLYWTMEGGESMAALNTATMEFTVVELPAPLRQLSFDVVEKGEDDNGLYILTMRGFCVEVWAGVDDGAGAGAGGMSWTRVEKSVRFHKAMAMMQHDSVELYHHGLDVIGVVAGVLFLRQWNCLLSIDLETMRLRRLSDEDCSSAMIYPFAMPWPPAFLNPTEEHGA
uniref:F-box protein AT5G49610-like beta-propeller domain-containing protein n=1 Tax=Leersia perrieri TaxID=77586 RepID=A0A0D9WCS2_9ORYZ